MFRVGEGEFEAQGGAQFGRAVEEDSPVQRLDPVFEAEQAGAAAQSRTAATVVADLHPQRVGVLALDGVDLDLDQRGGGMFGGVGQRLGHDVVGGDLDLLGQSSLDRHFQLDGDGAAQRRVPPAPDPAPSPMLDVTGREGIGHITALGGPRAGGRLSRSTYRPAATARTVAVSTATSPWWIPRRLRGSATSASTSRRSRAGATGSGAPPRPPPCACPELGHACWPPLTVTTTAPFTVTT